jgi:nucleoside-diphosphate-sugar epimerase
MILVTGASGLVGGALIRLLSHEGVRAGAALRTPLPLPPGIEFREAPSLGPDADWRKALLGAHTVVHAAARVHQMRESGEDLLALYRQANRDGTLALARQAVEAGIKRFVFVSTLKVMGEESPQGRPFRTDDTPHPQDPYAISKWEAEQGLAELAARSGLELVVLRPPLVYGQGVKANMLALARLAAKGIPLPFASIRNRRSLMGIENLAQALHLLATHPKAAGRTYFIQDATLSTPELVQALALAGGRTARLAPFPPALIRLAAWLGGKGQTTQRLLSSLEVDDQPLRRELGWIPLISMKESLTRMVLSFHSSQDL